MNQLENLLFKFTFALLILSLGSCNKLSNTDTSKPNIIIILSDDSGYSDISYFGSEIKTPNLSRLAKNGLVIPNFYNNGRCSPSRASLLTGQYPQKVGVGELSRPNTETRLPGYLGYLNPDYPTIAEMLQSKGYLTIMSGKWHLGGQGKNKSSELSKLPSQRGFEKFFGTIGGTLRTHFKPTPLDKYYVNNTIQQHTTFDDDFYSSDAIVDYALSTIQESRSTSDQPFFLYLPFNAPHLPLEAPSGLVDKYLDKYSNYANLDDINKTRFDAIVDLDLLDASVKYSKREEPNIDKLKKEDRLLAIATHAAMIENMDANVGRLVDDLKDRNELDNTIIIYLSDNGVSALGVSGLFNAPYYGRKGMLAEGGIKTPLIVHWPGGLKNRGTIRRKAWHIMDIAPTILDILGSPDEGRSMAGRSFKSELLSSDTENENDYYLDREFLFWNDRTLKAGIDRDGMKWLNTNAGDNLYNLINDPCETRDISGFNEGYVKTFKRAYATHRRQNNIENFATVERNRINK